MCWRNVSCSECFRNHCLQLRESSVSSLGPHRQDTHHLVSFTWINLKRSEGNNILAQGICDSWALQFSPPEHLIMVAGWATTGMERIKNSGNCSQPEALLPLKSCSFWRQPASVVIVGIQRPSSLPQLAITLEGYTSYTASIQLLLPPTLVPFLPHSCFSPEYCHVSFLHTSSISMSFYGTQPGRSESLEVGLENMYFHKVLLVIINVPSLK